MPSVALLPASKGSLDSSPLRRQLAWSLALMSVLALLAGVIPIWFTLKEPSGLGVGSGAVGGASGELEMKEVEVVLTLSTVPHRVEHLPVLLPRLFASPSDPAPPGSSDCRSPGAKSVCWLPPGADAPPLMVDEVWLSISPTAVSTGEPYPSIPVSLVQKRWFRVLRVPKDFGPATKVLGHIYHLRDPPTKLDPVLVIADDDILYRTGSLNLLIAATKHLALKRNRRMFAQAAEAPAARGFAVGSSVLPLEEGRGTWRESLAGMWPPRFIKDCEVRSPVPRRPVRVPLKLMRSTDGSGYGLHPPVHHESYEFPAEEPQFVRKVSERIDEVEVTLVPGDILRGVSAFALQAGTLPVGWAYLTRILSRVSDNCILSDDLLISAALRFVGVGVVGYAASPEMAVFSDQKIVGGLPGPKLAHNGAEKSFASAHTEANTEARYLDCINDMDRWWAEMKIQNYKQKKTTKELCASLQRPWTPGNKKSTVLESAFDFGEEEETNKQPNSAPEQGAGYDDDDSHSAAPRKQRGDEQTAPAAPKHSKPKTPALRKTAEERI